MDRIGILTFLHNGNYGSSLQAYALQRVIREMGFECDHIDYQPDISEKVINLLCSRNHPKLLTEGRKKQQVLNSQPGARAKRMGIREFYQKHMSLSAPCRNHRDLVQAGKNYEILVCGSDQIWNPTWLNPAYFLNFAEPNKRRVAYAPSFGVQVLHSGWKTKKIRELTALFDAVSVREEEGARLMVTISGRRPPVMPDPVCLLEPDSWMEIAKPVQEAEHRLLCYFIGENQSYWDRVRAISERNGLEPLVIPVTEESYAQKLPMLDGADPGQFLGAMAEAEAVCTDSFHGLVFATIFEKKTELIRRYRDDDRESKNSRVDHFQREIKAKGLTAIRQEGLCWLEENLKSV